MIFPWPAWAVAEGMVKTIQWLLGKLVGSLGRTVEGAVLVTIVTGSAQVVGGAAGTLIRRQSLRVSPRQLLGSLLWGVMAAAAMLLTVLIFTYEGADVGVATFIVALSIVPGALLDHLFFGNLLSSRRWIGIGLFILAGYAVLNFPSLATLSSLPVWMWIAVSTSFLAATSEAVSQALARDRQVKLDPWLNNFYAGFAIVLFGGVGLLLGDFSRATTAHLPHTFWVGSAIFGALNIPLLAFKLLSYYGGGNIALKKVIVRGTNITLAAVLGWLLFGEVMTWGKVVGIGGYLVAFTVMDDQTWRALTIPIRTKKAVVEHILP